MTSPSPSRPPQGLIASQSRNATPGLRYPSTKKTIYDRNLNRTKNAELSRAAFAYLFIEMINYAQRQVKGITDLEKRLNQAGYPLGLRLLDLLATRNTTTASSLPGASARPTRILALLQFITTTLWKALFGRPADALERSAANPAEYMISDNEPLVNAYVSVPREMSQLNCAAFVAGIVEGVCDGAGFRTEGVGAHWAADPSAAAPAPAEGKPEAAGLVAGAAAPAPAADRMWPGKTVFLLRFADEVLEREELLGKAP